MSATSSPRKAVLLISGGLDSATVLALVKAHGYDIYALTVLYGQRASAEVDAAKHLCEQAHVQQHRLVEINLHDLTHSALTQTEVLMPHEHDPSIIPVTYVQARNTVFLSLALSYAETVGARDIFFGAHIIDYSNYPDCRPEFIEAFAKVAELGTKTGVELGHGAFKIHAPLIQLDKGQIIRLGLAHGVDYSQTISCYDADELGRACGLCPPCIIRREGFKQAGIADPTLYQ